jgi:uncharacterized surface protein with fasciclin (FAS1) repeats
MKWNKIFRGALWMTAASLAMAPAFTSCDDYMDGDDWVSDSQLQLDETIAEDPDLSLFYSLIEQADAIGMVHAYGTYTMFAPINEAVETYFGASDEGSARSAIEALSQDSALTLVKYHMLSDTLYTADFTDTRLSCANMDVDYLTSRYLYDAATGENYYLINNKARIITADQRTGNGILHVVDCFLARPKYSVRDVFDQIDQYATDGKSYSICNNLMKEILSSDQYSISLDSILAGQTYLTFLAQPDSVMEAEGLTSLDAVIEALQANNISNYSEEQLLSNWIGYHFLKGRYFKGDIQGATSINTCTSLGKVVTVTTIDEDIYLNRYEDFDDPGIPMITDGAFVDFICGNGVVQSLNGELEIIERAATRINWDMADQPEIRALKGYRKAGTTQYFYSTLTADDNGYVATDLSMMSWTGKNTPTVLYECDFVPKLGELNFDVKSEYVYGDYLNFRLATHVMQYIEIKTPTLVTGKYKVWLRYRAMGTYANGHGTVRTTFIQDGAEDQVFGTVILSEYGSSTSSREDDEQLAAKGRQQPQPYYPNQHYVTAVCLGTIDVQSDGVHTLRLDATETNQSLGQNYDMLMFIPIDLDQVYPRVAVDGNDARVYKVVLDADGNRTLDRTVYYDVSGFSDAYRSHVFPNQCGVVGGTLDIGMCPYTWCPNHDAANFTESAE